MALVMSGFPPNRCDRGRMTSTRSHRPWARTFVAGTCATLPLIAPPVAFAADTPLPIAQITGGGPGGSIWTDIEDSRVVCGRTGFAIGDAELGTLDDAYDSAWLLANGSDTSTSEPYVAPDPVDVTDATVTGGAQTLGSLQVSTQYKFFQDAARLRVVHTFTNPTAAPITQTFQSLTNLGSDSATTIVGTSSGDLAWTSGDRWLVTRDTSDPVVSTVTSGPGSTLQPTLVSFTCTTTSSTPGTEDDVRSVWEVTVPGGQTRYLVFFAELSPTATDALAAMADYDTAPALSDERFAGIAEAELSKILNWQFEAPTPAPSPPAAQYPVDCGVFPKRIRSTGTTKVLGPGCRTNAGKKVRVSVTARAGGTAARGDVVYFRLITRKDGTKLIRTFGHRLNLRLTFEAPATGEYAAYTAARGYKLR